MDKALGISPDGSPADNGKSLKTYFDKTSPEGDKLRQNVVDIQPIFDPEFSAPGVEIGWFYPSCDVDKEGSQTHHGKQSKENAKFDVTTYHPSAISGHHFPHPWVEKEGRPISTWDLELRNRSVLVTMTDQPWLAMQSQWVHIETIADSPKQPRSVGWTSLNGVNPNGAVLDIRMGSSYGILKRLTWS